MESNISYVSKKEKSIYWLKVVLLWLSIILFLHFCFFTSIREVLAENAVEAEQKVADFISGDDEVEEGLRIITVCRGNDSDAYRMKLICKNLDESSVFEVIYHSESFSSIETPTVDKNYSCYMRQMEGDNQQTSFNSAYVTGKQLAEGCVFSLKNNQSAVILGIPHGTRYTLTDLSETIYYDREPLGGNDAASENMVAKTAGGVVSGVRDTEKSVETIGFQRTWRKNMESRFSKDVKKFVKTIGIVLCVVLGVAFAIMLFAGAVQAVNRLAHIKKKIKKLRGYEIAKNR